MKKELEKTFRVPEELKLEQVGEENGDTVLYCSAKKQKVLCKYCGGKTIGYDTRTTNKKHTVVSGKTVWLRITRQRVQCTCKDCGKVFVLPIEGIPRSVYSDHFTQQVQEKARGQDYSTVSREMGISCASVSIRVSQLNVELIKKVQKKAPSLV